MMDAALKLAIEEFKKIDLRDLHNRSGACVNEREIQIEYLNHKYSIRLPGVEITYINGESDVSPREKIILLHYLNRSKGTPLSGKSIDFREVPGGNTYYPVFEDRVHRPFLEAFGESSHLLLEASLALKGEKGDFGDISFRIPVFPKVPIDFAIYEGDEEFPPACKVLFDPSINDYLSTEDIVVVCEDIVKELRESLKL